MYRGVILIALLVPALFHGTVVAQDKAVSSVNGEANFSLEKFKFRDPDTDTFNKSVGAQGNIPLGRYFGLNLAASRGKQEQSGLADIDSDISTYSASPFWRNPKIGLVGVTAERSNFKFSGAASGRFSINQKAVNASAYFESATLSLFRAKSTLENGVPSDFNFVFADFVWYPIPDFLIDLGVGGQDAKKSYILSFEHQLPKLPGLGYGLSYIRDNQDRSSGWLLTVAYRFAEPKSLMRRYREDLFGGR